MYVGELIELLKEQAGVDAEVFVQLGTMKSDLKLRLGKVVISRTLENNIVLLVPTYNDKKGLPCPRPKKT